MTLKYHATLTFKVSALPTCRVCCGGKLRLELLAREGETFTRRENIVACVRSSSTLSLKGNVARVMWFGARFRLIRALCFLDPFLICPPLNRAGFPLCETKVMTMVGWDPEGDYTNKEVEAFAKKAMKTMKELGREGELQLNEFGAKSF